MKDTRQRTFTCEHAGKHVTLTDEVVIIKDGFDREFCKSLSEKCVTGMKAA